MVLRTYPSKPQRIGEVAELGKVLALVLQRHGIKPEENVSLHQDVTHQRVTQLELDFGDDTKPNKPR
jgi:hypothetical protein